MEDEAIIKRRRQHGDYRDTWERLPDGTRMLDIGLSPWLRRLLDPGRERYMERPTPYEDAALAQTPRPQVLTPQNQEAITRPRTVEQPEQRGGSFLEAFTRPRRAEPRDYPADDAAYLRDVRKQPRTWRDKIVDVTDALNAVAGGPKRAVPTKRERAILNAERQLETTFEAQKQALGQMVPVQLDNGQTVMVPARQAGTLQSQQQNVRQRSEASAQRAAANEARKRHWDNMDARDRKRLIVSLYNSGGLNDPELLEYAADQLGLPAPLRERFIAGQMRDAIDEEGNLIQINRQTQEALPTGQKSYEATKETGRQQRAAEAIKSRERIASMPARSTPRTQGPDRAAQRKAAQLIGTIERARGEMEAADKAGDKARRERARLAGEQAAAELNALNAGYEAGPGEGGYPYYKQRAAQEAATGRYTGRRISQKNVAEFGRRHGMSPEEAAEFLRKEGATIY